MKIIYCISGTYVSGGMERVLANKANYLVQAGYEVVIVTSDQKERPAYFPMDSRITMKDLGINYCDSVHLPILQKILLFRRKQRQHQKVLTELLFELNADIVISMFDHEVEFLYKIPDRSIKLVEIHFSRFKRLQYGRKGLLKIIDQYRSKRDLQLVQKYKRFIVLTEEDKGYWGKLKNIKVIPNSNSFEIPESALLVNKQAIAVGRFDYQKGFEDLIEIWAKVHPQEPEWKLRIFGHGELKEKFNHLIKEHNLQNVVQLCSPTKEIQKEYLSSSMLLMTSRYEGLPMTLLEAQVCGLPLIAYACKCGPRDIIKDGQNGYLIQEGDMLQMTERILTVIRSFDVRQQLGNAAKRMSNEFSENNIMKKWTDLFKEVL